MPEQYIEPFVDGFAVEEAIKAHLSTPDEDTGGTWISTGLGKVERANGLEPGQIERPRGVVTSREFAKWPEDELPVIVVIAAGLARAPELRGDGSYEASWLIGLAPVVGDVDEETTRMLALGYGAAVRYAMLAKPSLGGFATNTYWRDEKYDDLGPSRSLAAARIVFEVVVANVAQRGTSLAKPLGDPATDPGPLPDADRPFEIDVDLTPITEAVPA